MQTSLPFSHTFLIWYHITQGLFQHFIGLATKIPTCMHTCTLYMYMYAYVFSIETRSYVSTIIVLNFKYEV